MYRQIPLLEKIPTLRAAIDGDMHAQQAILDHFDAYIKKLSTITLYTDDGHSYTYLDEDILVQVQTRVLESLKSFDLEGILQGRIPRSRLPKKTPRTSRAESRGLDL